MNKNPDPDSQPIAQSLGNKNFYSPREFLKSRRPDKFSDSKIDSRVTLDRSYLEYLLQSLTSRNQEVDFERFARRLAEKIICPNLIPHTGPTGGGDSKVDSETYPVSDSLSMVWCSGIGREASNERWAFAVSAKKIWQEKLRSDIAKIAKTDRGYAKAFFITNQFVKDKFRAKAEEKLTKEFKLDVRIFDRTWILDKLFEGRHESIAIEELHITLPKTSRIELGPLDLAKKTELESVEKQIAEIAGTGLYTFEFVNLCIEAAELARSLELPRSEVDGKFIRAERVASEHGNDHQKVLAAYSWAWTTYWWFEDYRVFSAQYGQVEKYSTGTENIFDLELLTNLWFGLTSSVRDGRLDSDAANLNARTEHLFNELNRFQKQDERPSAALQARSLDLLAQLVSTPPSQAEVLLLELQKVVQGCNGLLGFPFETLGEVLAELGVFLGNNVAYNKLHDLIVETVSKRQGEVSGAKMLLKRGAQQLNQDRPYEAIRSIGRALNKLYKDESRHELIRALYLCGTAYERIGLLWAARGSTLVAASLVSSEFRKYSDFNPAHAACFTHLKWLELRLGRLPQILAWHETDAIVKTELGRQGYQLQSEGETERNFDVILGMLLLNANIRQLHHLQKLPDVIDNLNLPMTAVALQFALGHDDKMPEALFAKGTSQSEMRVFFDKWCDQPAAKDIPDTPTLYEDQKVILKSIIAGCDVIVDADNSSPCVELSESVLAAMEGLFATGVDDRLLIREPSITISVRKSDVAVSSFTFQLSDVEGRPHLEISCALFDPHKLSREIQSKIKEQLTQLLLKVLGRICLIDDYEATLTKLFKDELALERAVNFSNSFIVLGNVLGHEPKTSLDSWIDSRGTEYQLKRSVEWNAFRRQDKKSRDQAEGSSKFSMGTGNPPEKFSKMADASHTNMKVLSLIREPLWNSAKWSGTAFFRTENLEHPPIFALMFENQAPAMEIFTYWQKELGKMDKAEKLRISVIRGIDKKNPHKYRVIIGINPGSAMASGSAKYMTMVNRMHIMMPSTSENLDRFLEDYTKAKVYALGCARFNSATNQPEICSQDFIFKREINIKNAWEIGPNDIDSIGIYEDDDVIIPTGNDNPPVSELIKLRQQYKSTH